MNNCWPLKYLFLFCNNFLSMSGKQGNIHEAMKLEITTTFHDSLLRVLCFHQQSLMNRTMKLVTFHKPLFKTNCITNRKCMHALSCVVLLCTFNLRKLGKDAFKDLSQQIIEYARNFYKEKSSNDPCFNCVVC